MTTELAQTELEKLYAKIEKLLALQSSSNEHEAALAAERVQELLLKYNISLEAVENRASQEEIGQHLISQMPNNRRYVWAGVLSNKVGQVNFVRTIWQGKALYGIGRPVNIYITRETYLYLVQAIERVADQAWRAWKKEANPTSAESTRWYNSFVDGCVTRICNRLDDLIKRQAAQGTEDGTVSAIVCVSLREKEESAIADWVAENLKNLKPGSRHTVKRDWSAYCAGSEAGDTISLAKQVQSGEEQPVLAGR